MSTPSRPDADRPTRDDAPASVVFMEIMRRAADRTTPPAPTPDVPAPPVEAAPPPPPTAPDAPTIPTMTDAQRAALNTARRARRSARRTARRASLLGGAVRAWMLVGVVALITATLFTWSTAPELLAPQVRGGLSVALATATQQRVAALPSPPPITPNWARRVAIVSGHRGPQNDPGALCADGLREADINFEVAQRVVRNLQARGYSVELFDEFDPRLPEYNGEVLVSLHANDCRDYGSGGSGYLVSTADARFNSSNDQLLVECLALHHEQATGLVRRTGLTRDMTDYHVFRSISPRTPGAILEMGFMRLDRAILTEQPDLLARGVADGILCFLEPSNPNILATLTARSAIRLGTATPAP